MFYTVVSFDARIVYSAHQEQVLEGFLNMMKTGRKRIKEKSNKTCLYLQTAPSARRITTNAFIVQGFARSNFRRSDEYGNEVSFYSLCRCTLAHVESDSQNIRVPFARLNLRAFLPIRHPLIIFLLVIWDRRIANVTK